MYEHMELVVIHLAGPMFIEIWSGMSYVFMAVEVSTRMGVAELMVSKDETPEILKATVAKLEHQSGIKLKRMRSDNGTEFVNNIIHSFCQQNGIIHETTVPYTPEQNGIAESAIHVRLRWLDACCIQQEWTYDIGVKHSCTQYIFATYPPHLRSKITSLSMSGLDENQTYLTSVYSDRLCMPISQRRSEVESLR
jgi:hypothetical protein